MALIAGLERFSLLLLAVIVIICIGLTLASLGEMEFSAIGMSMVVGAITLSSIVQVYRFSSNIFPIYKCMVVLGLQENDVIATCVHFKTSIVFSFSDMYLFAFALYRF